MVWLQTEMGPTAQVSSVWEHHLWATGPLQEHLAARRHTGEQVSATALTSSHIWPQPANHSHFHEVSFHICIPTWPQAVKLNFSAEESLDKMSITALCSL